MKKSGQPDGSSVRRLDSVIAEYSRRVEAGEAVDREAFLAAYRKPSTLFSV